MERKVSLADKINKLVQIEILLEEVEYDELLNDGRISDMWKAIRNMKEQQIHLEQEERNKN